MPSKVVTVLICENARHDGTPCGAWKIVPRGELPFCYECKRPERTWRLATEQEIAAYDRRFLHQVERFGIRGPDGHLGGCET